MSRVREEKPVGCQGHVVIPYKLALAGPGQVQKGAWPQCGQGQSPVTRGTNLMFQSNTVQTWTQGLRIPIYSFAIVFMKVSSCEVQKKTDTNENQNFIITFRNHSAQPRNASNLWLLGQLSGTPACLSNGLATNNLVPILKPAKCGLLKLSSTSQLW